MNLESKLFCCAEKDYSPRVIQHETAFSVRQSLVPQFVDLYGKFGYNEEEVSELLTNDSNTVCYVEDQEGQVVSTALAERATIEVEGCADIVVVEITEAITLTEMRGKGLYSSLSGFLVEHLLEDHTQRPISIIYGESNLSSPGVIYSARKNGRLFSFYDGAIFGIDRDDFGILEQNFSVNDGVETRPYNDFALSYVPL